MTISAPGPDVIGPETPLARPRRRPARGRRVLEAGVGAVAVLVAGSGIGAVALLSRGGQQPEQVLPAGAVAFAKVDLDPAADQKIKAFRLARRFPDAGVGGQDDLPGALLRPLLSSSGLDYARDVQPWAGDRAGIAVLPSKDANGDPEVLLAVQVGDRRAADRLLPTLAMRTGGPVGHAYAGDYALLSDGQGVVDDAVGAARHLADDEAYTRAVDRLPGDQVAVAWTDLGRLAALVPGLRGPTDLKVQGALVAGAHVGTDFAELDLLSVGLHGSGQVASFSRPGGLAGRMPADAVAAVGISGLGAALAGGYPTLTDTLGREQSAALTRQAADFGVRLPQDLVALLGDQTAGFVRGTADAPEGALVTRGGDPARAAALLDRLGLPADQVAARPGGLSVGSTPAAARAVAGSGQARLADDPGYRAAVPDPAAPLVAYVDVQKALALNPGGAPAGVAPLRAVGLSGRSTGGEDSAYRVRLTFS